MKVKDIETIVKKYKFTKKYDEWKYGGSTAYEISFGKIFAYEQIDLTLNFNVQLDTLDLSFWALKNVDASFHFIVKELSKTKASELEYCIKKALELMKGAKYLRFEEKPKENLENHWSPM